MSPFAPKWKSSKPSEILGNKFMSKLSAIVVTHNEEEDIEDCLKSLEWADEIILVDGQSTDKTIEIARRYTDKTYQKENDVCEIQRIFGLDKAVGEWILFLDADERITSALKREIILLLSKPEETCAGYFIQRENFFYGHRVHYGSPDYHLRLMKKDRVKPLPKKIHQPIGVYGRTAYLKEAFLHYPFKDISDHIKSVNFYTGVEAGYLCEEGSPILRWYNFGWYFIIRPFLKFLQSYLFMKGWMDGFRGVTISGIAGYYEFLKYAKYWERLRLQKEGNA